MQFRVLPAPGTFLTIGFCILWITLFAKELRENLQLQHTAGVIETSAGLALLTPFLLMQIYLCVRGSVTLGEASLRIHNGLFPVVVPYEQIVAVQVAANASGKTRPNTIALEIARKGLNRFRQLRVQNADGFVTALEQRLELANEAEGSHHGAFSL